MNFLLLENWFKFLALARKGIFFCARDQEGKLPRKGKKIIKAPRKGERHSQIFERVQIDSPWTLFINFLLYLGLNVFFYRIWIYREMNCH